MKDKTHPSANSGHSILIVDDDESTCRTLTLIFDKKGHETETAGTGREALEKAQEGFFNLALLDIKLPDMKGVELVAPLKEMHPDMDVIMVTAYASLETAMQALNEGASAYITKPLNMDEVLATVKGVFERQCLMMEKRQAEKKVRNLMESVPVGITVSTPEEGVTEANLAVYKIFGYDSQEDFLRIPTSAHYCDQKDRERFAAKLDKDGAVKNFETRFKRKDGTIFWGSVSSITQTAETGAAQFINVIEDITERVQADAALRESEKQLQTLIDAMPDFVCFKDGDGRWLKVNDTSIRIFQLEDIDYLGKKDSELAELNSHLQDTFLICKESDARAWEEGSLIHGEEMISRPDGSVRVYDVTKVPVFHPNGERKGLIVLGHDITEGRQAQEEERRHFQEIGFLAENAMRFVDFSPEKDIYRFVGEGLKELTGESIVVVNSIDEARGILTTRAVLGMGKYSKGILELIGRNPEGMEYDASGEDITYLSDGRLHDYRGGMYGVFLGEIPEPVCRAMEKLYSLNKIYTIGFVEGKRLFGTAVIFLPQGSVLENEEIIETFIIQASIAIQRQLAQVALQRRNCELALLNQIIVAASTTLDPKTVMETTCRELALVFDVPMVAAAILNDARTASVVVAEYLSEGYSSALDVVIPLEGNPTMQYIMEHKAPLVVVDAQHDPRLAVLHEPLRKRGTVSMLILPLMVRDQVVGTLGLDVVERREFSGEEIDLATNAVSTAAQVLEKARLFDQANRRLKRMEALHSMDKAILSSVDINLTTDIFLDHALTQLEVDAVDVLLFNPILQTLECIGRKGFRTSALKHTNLRLGQGQAGQVALQREIKHIPDLREEKEVFLASPDLSEEEFIAYYGIPLIAKGILKGVLEIFHRGPLTKDDEWMTFLNAMARQVAIAIDNTSMFTDLQRSNIDLAIAYDSTLEGWASALELRDMETEGHSRRVTEMTMNLAKALGVGKDQLAHLYRGALLHDIGKMGVPDSILNKPGPLTDEEWVIMHQHPVYAHDMLSPIEYIRPALDIPYCHHEKWDGSGYPRGLQGEQIPLAARIFAIVDVWDALNSDRPYRKAWPKKKVIAHIKEQSGKHFDPQVVDVFLNQVLPK